MTNSGRELHRLLRQLSTVPQSNDPEVQKIRKQLNAKMDLAAGTLQILFEIDFQLLKN